MEEAKVDSFVDSKEEEDIQQDFDKSETETKLNSSSTNLVVEEEEDNMDKSNAKNNSLTHQDNAQLGIQTPKENMQKVDGQQGKDRTMDSNVMAANAADKHAEYVGGKLKRLGETGPVQKTVSALNRIRGSAETNDQTLGRISNAVYSADYGITYLAWRLIYGLKDMTSNAYTVAQRKGLTRPPVIALGIALLLPILTVMSPFLVGLAFVLIPTFFFGFLFFGIPSICGTVVFLLFVYLFGGMPKLYSMANNLLNKIFGNDFGNRIEGEEGNDNPGTSQNN
uniref:Uncharacterized protein n=1 Tax=Meloidogyne enterolobii TaxID=390850 RepID=A0A6V7TIN2_MELEN|nr:unnamed protein product [Meloidogyne enterolobii]